MYARLWTLKFNADFQILKISRDPKLFATFGKAWYAGSFQSYPAFPKTVLISSDFESVSPASKEVYNAFFAKLVNFLGGTMTNYSITAEFNVTGNSSVPLTTLLNTVCLQTC